MANAFDATQPDRVVPPPNCQTFPVQDLIVALFYNAALLRFQPPAGDILSGTTIPLGDSLDATEEHNRFMNEFRIWLAKGYTVIVRGWLPHLRVSWQASSVKSFKGSVEQTIQYQGAQ